MEYFGPISRWDSSPAENHHKTQLKEAPAKTTQLRPAFMIKQTANCQDEFGVVEAATREFSPKKLANNPPKIYSESGAARFTIKKNSTNHNAIMTWHKPNEELPIHSK